MKKQKENMFDFIGLIKEPLNADFVVDTRPLTKAEEKAISDFIRANKERCRKKELRTKTYRN